MTKGVKPLKDEQRLQKDKERYAEAEREIQHSIDKLANVVLGGSHRREL